MANKSSSTSKSTTTKKSTATKKPAAPKAESPKVKAQVLATETTITVTESAPTPPTQVAEPEPVKRTYATNDMIPCKTGENLNPDRIENMIDIQGVIKNVNPKSSHHKEIFFFLF